MVKINKVTQVTATSSVSGGVSVKPGAMDPLISPTNSPVFEHDATASYAKGDFVLVKKEKTYVLYEATQDNTGVFDEASWKPYTLAGKLEEQEVVFDAKLAEVDGKIDDVHTALDDRVTDVEDVLAELSDTVYQDDEGLSRVTAIPALEGVLYTDEYNPFVSLFERGIDRFKGLSLGGSTVPISTDVSIDLGPAPESGISYNSLFVEIFKVMTRTGVRMNYRLRTVSLTEDEFLESKNGSRFLVPNTLKTLASTRIKPISVLDAEVVTDESLEQTSTLYKYGSYLSVADRDASTIVAQQTRLFDTEVYIAGDGSFESKTALGTVDGFMYAIPLQYIKRRNNYPYSLFNKDGGSSYVEADVKLIDTNLKPNSVFPVSLTDATVTFKEGDVYFLGAPENDVKIQYTGTMDSNNRPLFTFVDQLTAVTFDSLDQTVYSYAKGSSYYNIVTNPDVESIVKAEVGGSTSYSDLLVLEFNKLLRGELKLSSREIVEYFGPESYDTVNDTLNENHFITAQDRYRTQWSNRPAYIEIERTVSPIASENESDVELAQRVEGAFQTNDTIKFTSKNIIAPPLDDTLQLSASEVLTVSGNTVTLDNVTNLSVGDNVNIVNPVTLEIVSQNLVVNEVNTTLMTIKLSNASTLKEGYLVLESSITPYFIVSADNTKASWVDINTRNPLAKLMTPNATTTLQLDENYTNTFEEMSLDFLDQSAITSFLKEEKIKEIDCGDYHTVDIKQDGSLWAWGYNDSGQLGDGTTINRTSPVQIGTDKTWSSIACGNHYTIALKQDGSLWAWGRNDYGQLGDGTTGDKRVPTQIGTDKTWTSISCGAYHTVAIKQDGSLWAWGYNPYGQVGDGTTTQRNIPTQIGSDKTWTSISCGVYHTVALKQDGSLCAWGYNSYGQLGDGTTTNKSVPTQIGSDKTWSYVACGTYHTVAFKQDGSLWAWGRNDKGQLGDGTTVDKSVPTQIGTDMSWASVYCGFEHTVALKQDGSLLAWGSNNYGQLGDGTTTNKSVPTQIGTDKTWYSLACGGYHTLALKQDGSLWAWGNNENGQLGNGTTTNSSIPLEIIKSAVDEKGEIKVKYALGTAHTALIKQDGSLWAWGYNKYGQLGDGTTNDKTVPTQIGTDKTWTSISCGAYHTVAFKQDGSLWAWGVNNYGQLGDGTTTNKSVPTQIGTDKTWSSISCGDSHTVALKQDGSLWAWGYNKYGQLGDGTTNDKTVPTQIGTDKTWTSISCGAYHTVAFKQDGSLWAWGVNNYGQLGDGTTTNKSVPTQIGTDKTWSSISCGYYHTVALKQDGSLWAWGINTYGQLGDGTTTDKSVPTQIGTDKTWSSLYCGDSHTVALKQDGSLWAWGSNGIGQLGDGTTTDKSVPTQIGTETKWLNGLDCLTGNRGSTTSVMDSYGGMYFTGYNASGQIGNGTTTNLSTLTLVMTLDVEPIVAKYNWFKEISSNYYHTVALKQDGSLWAWGRNNYGQLGDGTTINRTSPVQIGTDKTWSSLYCGDSHTVALKQDGSLWAWGYNKYGQLGDGTTNDKTVPTQIGTDKTWTSISCGAYHTVAFKQDGSLWAWGVNNYGQLGDGTTTNKSVPTQIGTDKTWSSISCGHYHTVALKQDGSLWAWGINTYGQLGDGTTSKIVPTQIGTDKTWSSISCGHYHTVALKQDGSLWAWGFNSYSQLGDGTTTNKSVPTQIGTDKTWSSIYCGFEHTVALKQDGSLWAWGYNDYGELGDGTTTKKSVPTQIGTDKTWSSITCGGDHTVALKQDNSLWAWGNNSNGELGDGTTTKKLVPTSIGEKELIDGGSSNALVPPISKLTKFSGGVYHVMAIREDGTLWGMGLNDYGELGDGTITSKSVPTQIGTDKTWSSISCGSYHTVAIKQDGSLWAWGYNFYGQLGDGTTTNKSVPTQIGTDKTWSSIACGGGHTVALKQDGSLWAWGYNFYGQLGDGTTTNKSVPTQIGTDKTWSSLYCGDSHTVALKQDGSLWAWGNNNYGQLGDGTTTDKSVPTQIGTDKTWSSITTCGGNHTVALKQDGSLWAWGYNTHGQLGDGTTTNKSVPTQIGTDKTWSSIACGGSHTVALKQDGSLWAWGNNNYGQLGLGTYGSDTHKSIPTKINMSVNVREIVPMAMHTLFITNDVDIYHTGLSVMGTTTVGTNALHVYPVLFQSYRKIACGGNHTVALKQDGSLWAWGINGYGELGDGTTTNKSVPTQIGTDKTWSSIACGGSHTVALKQDGSLWAWGNNNYGQLGDGTTTDKLVPTSIGVDKTWSSIACGGGHTVALKQDGSLWAWGSNGIGQLGDGTTTKKSVPTQIGTDKTWSSIACGDNHTIALKQDGSLWAWGINGSGQLGDGTWVNKSTPIQIGSDKTWSSIACGGYHTIALKQDGSLWAWGNNDFGQLGDGTTANKSVPTQIGTDKTWSSISCAYEHSIAIKQDGSLWAWGSNDKGQLGDGTATDKLVPIQINTDNNWSSVAGGQYHTFVIKQDGSLWAWGNNDFGQLGDGTSDNKLAPFRTQTLTDKSYNKYSKSYPIQNGYITENELTAEVLITSKANSTRLSGLTENLENRTIQGLYSVGKICDNGSSILIKSASGSVYTSGSNTYGQLLTGNTTTKTNITVVLDITVKDIALGTNFTVLIKPDGTLWSVGLNDKGQLGQADTTNRTTLTQIGLDTDWKSVEAGASTVIALKEDGTVYEWGLLQDKSNGATADVIVNIPTKIATLSGAKEIRSGLNHRAAITNEGVFIWGRNVQGELCDDTTKSVFTPIEVKLPGVLEIKDIQLGNNFTLILTKEGQIYGAGDNSNGQLLVNYTTAIPKLTRVKLSRRAERTIKVSGTTVYVYLNDSFNNSTVTGGLITTPITIGKMGTVKQFLASTQKFVLLTDGSLWAWGKNDYGQLGDGTTTNKSVPTQIGTDKTWSSIACGLYHTVAIKQDGSLWAWGYNYGILGDGTTTNKSIPTQIGTDKTWTSIACGAYHTVAIKQDGSLWAWGSNGSGQLGNNTTVDKSVLTQIGTDKTWKSISCGDYHTVALKQDGSLWAWGYNGNGQLGDGTTTNKSVPIQIGIDKTWAFISCGCSHTVALKQDGSLCAWGKNDYGQLGDGTTTNKSVPTQIGTDKTWSSISCGFAHTLALKQDGSLWAWGKNDRGQLGDGTETSKSTPTSIDINGQDIVKIFLSMSSSMSIIISNNNNILSTIGTVYSNQSYENHFVKTSLDTFNKLSYQKGFTLGLKEGLVYSWGLNANGQLAQGTTGVNNIAPTKISEELFTDIAAGVTSSLFIKEDGTLWVAGSMNSNKTELKQVGTDVNWSKVFTRNGFIVLVKTDGTLWEWYEDLSVTLPTQVGTATNWSTNVAIGTDHTIILKTDNTLWGWGTNAKGELGATIGEITTPVQLGTATNWNKIGAGYQNSYAVNTDNEVYGLGSTRFVGTVTTPTKVTLDFKVLNVWSYGNSTFLQSSKREIYAIGDNTNGKLGVNDNLTELAKVLEFGSEIFVGNEGTIINTGTGYVVAGSSQYGQLGNISSYVTSSTSTTTFKYRELLPPAEGINSAIKDGGNLSTVNGIQYQKDNYTITFAFPVNKLQVSVNGTDYEKINQANLPTAKFVKLNAEEEIANMLKTSDVSVLKAVLNVNGTEIQTTTTDSLNVVFPVNAIAIGSRISVSVEVELGDSFASKEGESIYTPTQVRVNDTNRDTLNTVSQNILPELTKYSPYVSVPTFTDKGSSVSFAGDAIVSATVYLDTSLTYTLEGASTNTKVEISSEDSALIFTSSMTTASTKVNLLKSSTDTVKGYKKVAIRFSAVDTTKQFEIVKSLGLYNSFQKAVSPMTHYANEVEVVFDGTKHQVQTVNSNKVGTTIAGYDASTKTAKVTISETITGMGLKLNLNDSVGDLTAHQLNEQLDTLAINATITVGTTKKAYKLKVKDYVSGNYHELTKVGSTFILNVNATSSARYVDGDRTLTVLIESDTAVTGDEIKVTFDDIKIFTDASDIDIETRFLPIIYLNSNGDIRTQTGLFNQFGKASEMRFVVHETIKLQPVKDLTGITVIQEADDILITDVVSTNVGLVDHPFKNPLGLFDGIVTDNLVGVVGFKEARFEADSKFTNLSSNFKIVDGQLVGLSSQDTELVLSSPVIGLTKALVNTSDGLAIMITAIPTSNGKFDTFAAENTRYIIPLNKTLSSPIETFDYQTIHKG